MTEEKYTPLKDDASDVFTGDKLTELISNMVVVSGDKVILQGIPSCPGCSGVLAFFPLQDKWYCKVCETTWTTHSLIEALQNEKAAMRLYEVSDEQDE